MIIPAWLLLPKINLPLKQKGQSLLLLPKAKRTVPLAF
jgi:hypothetical protein